MHQQDDLHPPAIERVSAPHKAWERQLVVALREIEWGGPFGFGACPECGGMRRHGHAPGCRVGLALLPDRGIAALDDAVTEGLAQVAARRRALQALAGAADRELEDLALSLEWIQDLLHRA